MDCLGKVKVIQYRGIELGIEQISYLPFLPVENSSTCEHSVAHLTTLRWPCA